MSAYICEQHGTTPNPLCHVQQARVPSDRELHTWGYGGPSGRSQYERDAQYFGYADEHRSNAFAGCAFILGAAIVTVALWVTLIAWLLP